MPQTPSSFTRTIRALDADGMSPTLLAIILLAGLGGVWTSWLLVARVPVYQLSESARLEVERVHPVASPVSGRVVRSTLSLGRDVREGEVLLEIEAVRERLETDEERMRLAAVTGEIGQLQREIAAGQAVIDEIQRAGRAAMAEAAQRVAGAEVVARQARDKAARFNELEKQGLVSAAEAEAARADVAQRNADVSAAKAAVDRQQAEVQAAERERRGALAGLVREQVSLQGLRAATVSTVTRRERDADVRNIRAPVSGRLGEVVPIQAGAVVREGDRLASIIPQGQLRTVAAFAAPALGRIRPGQRARLRLDGFPWTQYGYIDATVASVASETRDQRVRVELAVTSRSQGSRMPLEHGMPGTVEVEVERAAPVALLLRSLGRTLSGDTGGSDVAEARPGKQASP
jgi:membrane fusion protein (multidrug efflux system)